MRSKPGAASNGAEASRSNLDVTHHRYSTKSIIQLLLKTGSSYRTVVERLHHDHEVEGLNPAGHWAFFSAVVLCCQLGGSFAQWLAYLHPDPNALGSIPSIPENFSEEKIVDVAEFIKWRCLEKSGQWLENVEQNHLGLSSGKLVLQKGCVVSYSAT